MEVINITDARAKLYSLVDEISESHIPLILKGKRKNAVLISEEDWSAINETLHLVSIEGMKESIVEGLKTDISECDEELNW